MVIDGWLHVVVTQKLLNVYDSALNLQYRYQLDSDWLPDNIGFGYIQFSKWQIVHHKPRCAVGHRSFGQQQL